MAKLVHKQVSVLSMRSPEILPDPEKDSDPEPHHLSAFVPLRQPAFRMLWGVWLAANICMWMNDVAAAWMMTSLTHSPTWVALVQTASTLPVFFLGLPSGALADILDRRRYFIATQFYVATVGLLLSIAVVSDLITPALLLALVFANGIGLAMRWPVFAAIVSDLVPRSQLPAALALNGIAMNASRIVGPVVAGAIISWAGSPYVFFLNALISLVAGFVVIRWRREHVLNPLGRERLVSAMRVGVQYVWQSSRLKAILLRTFLFFFSSTALPALLPLVARNFQRGSAGSYTMLLASMGAGAILIAMFLPRLRQAMSKDHIVIGGSVLFAAATVAVALSSDLILASAAMGFAGMAWITTANSLSVSAQLALPDWVRARGMSMFLMAIMGGSALGAAIWGQVATVSSVQISLLISGMVGLVAMLGAHFLAIDRSLDEDLAPSKEFKAPSASLPLGSGRVVVTIEYRINESHAEEFRALMAESRRSRLRQGALAWELLRDIEEPGRYIEQITDESWNDHLRRFDRITASDVVLRERRLAFHIGETSPHITRYLVDETVA
jgi:MFS family permease